MSVRRVLLIQLRALGDVLLCTPAVRQLRRAHPDARIDFLSEGAGSEALAGNPWLDEVVVYRRGTAAGVRRTIELARRGYDAVVVLHFHHAPRASVVGALLPAPLRIGFDDRRPWEWRYTHVVPAAPLVSRYNAVAKLELLRPLGVVPDLTDAALDFRPAPDDEAWAGEEWKRLGLEGPQPVVALSGVSRLVHKSWGADRWAVVADELSAAGFRVLLTHGPGERGQAEALAGAVRLPVLWGHREATLAQFAALQGRCRAWVGNDGGPRHLAVAMGVPTLAVARPGKGATFTDDTPGSPHRFVEPPPGAPFTRRRPLAELQVETVAPAVLAFVRRHADAAR
ncbi:MAG TPA: glycosyltransferase family 9 protein [Longimicrobium sp.]